jgi:XTP/dITP diphosphohydrolase
MNSDKFQLVVSSSNSDKLREMGQILSAGWLELVPLQSFPGAPTPKEGSFSLEENALIKARTARDFTGLASMGDDTGLEVDILDGKPGVFSSRYAGENASYQDNLTKLLDVLRSIPRQERGARFKCVVALALPDGHEKLFRGYCWGHLEFESRGENGFGYDPVFVPHRKKSTLAQLSPALKNRLSHRGKALRSLKRYLKKLNDGSRP